MNYKSLCINVVTIAKETGRFLFDEINKVKAADIEEKGLHNFVSYVDKTAEERIVNKLQKLLPDSGFIAEEGTAIHKGELHNWIIDPLDGTTNYLHHIPLYSVSIALMEHNEIVVGVVYEPNRDECFYAWKGGDAYLNDDKIHTTHQI